MDLAELKDENEELRKLLKGVNVRKKKKLIEVKQDDYAKIKKQLKQEEWVNKEKNETLLLSSLNGFSMKHEVSTCATFDIQIYLLH